MILGLIVFTWTFSHRPVGKGLSMLLLVRVVNCLGKCKETKEINPNQDRLDCDSGRQSLSR